MNRSRTRGNQLLGGGVRQARQRHFAGPRRDRTPRQSRLLATLLGRVALAGDRAFRADDARAASCGWQVAIGRAGLSRTYRDQRFDLLAGCPEPIAELPGDRR